MIPLPYVKRQQAIADNSEKIARVVNMRAGDASPMTLQDYADEARDLNIPPERLYALRAFESNSAFDDQGRLIIAYETHVFSRNTSPKHVFDKSHPRLSTKNWVNVRNLPQGAEHAFRLNNTDRWGLVASAMDLNFDAAICAISMGRWQILGEGWKQLGFVSPLALLEYLYEGERAQLDVTMRFWNWKNITPALRSGDWERFMRGWNGAGQVAYAVQRVKGLEAQYSKVYAGRTHA